MDFGYYYADGRYGDHNSEVFWYTNLTLIDPGMYDSAATWDNPNASLDIRRLFDASLREAYQNGKSIYIGLGGIESDWDRTLDVAAPYWDKVKYVEFYHENGAVTAAEAQSYVQGFANKLAARGLRRPLFVALESPGAEQAGIVDCAAIEAYIPQPFNQDDPGNVDRLNNILDARKAQVPAGKCIIVIMMAYDRNGQWTNIETLKMLQAPAYLKSYSDPRVSAITMFSYARPGGAKFYPDLQQIHQQMSLSIFGRRF
jgi:hypothetical protein